MGRFASWRFRWESFVRRFSVSLVGAGGKAAFPVLGDDSRAESLGSCFLGKPPTTCRRVPRWRSLASTVEAHTGRQGACFVANLRMNDRARAAMLQVPWFVELEIPLPEGATVEGVRERFDGTLRNETRRCERIFTTEFSTRDEDLVTFHRDFHEPLVSQRYGREGFQLDLPALRKRAVGGGLLKLFHEEQWIGGVTVMRRDNDYRIDSLGLVAGKREELPRLAITGLYWFALRMTIEAGMPRFALGGTTPVLEAGVHKFKDKWGARVNSATTYRAPQYLALDPAHPQCRDFLRRSTLYFWDGAGLALLGAIASEAELRERILRYQTARSLGNIYTVDPRFPAHLRAPAGEHLPAPLRASLWRIALEACG
jgi:hypothetical protein